MGDRGFHRDIRPGTLGHGDPAQYDYDTIAAYLKGADPTPLAAIGRAYGMASKAFQTVEQSLPAHLTRLTTVWQGAAQELGLEDLRRLTKAAEELATTSQHFQTAMNNGFIALKTAQFDMPTKTTPPTTPSHAEPLHAAAAKQANDKAAQQHLADTNAKLATSFTQIPPSVTLDLPNGLKREMPFERGAPGGTSPGSGAHVGGGSNGRTRTEGGEPGGSAGRAAQPGPGNMNLPGADTGPPGGSGPAGSERHPSDLQGATPQSPSGTHLPGHHVPDPSKGAFGPGAGPPDVLPPSGIPPGGLPPARALPPRTPMAPPVHGTPRPVPPGTPRPPLDDPFAERNPTGLAPLRPGGVIGDPGHAGSRPALSGQTGRDTDIHRMSSGGVIGQGAVSDIRSPSEMPEARPSGLPSGLGSPMGVGGANRAEKDRERKVWLMEDDGVWEADDKVAPRVIDGTRDR